MRGEFFLVANKVFDYKLRPIAFLVYCYLLKCNNAKNGCFPSKATIAESCGVAVSSVDKAIDELTRKGIRKVTGDKKEFMDLLLLADEQEDMIDRYLERGEMFVLDDNGVKAECVVTKEADDGTYELKNIAVLPECQRRGYGKLLIESIFDSYPDCKVLLVGTGDCPSSLAFYHGSGFAESHRVEGFFVDNYDHLMYEDGVQLVDMVYLKRTR